MIGMYLILIGVMKNLGMRFKVPTDRCTVIKNAVENFPDRKI